MKTFVKENTWLTHPLLPHGWGNGYVCSPPEHPLHGKDYTEIHELMPELLVNGGLTFAESANHIKNNLKWPELPEGVENYWVVGFDTSHSWDNMDYWPSAESVQREANKLAEQIQNYTP